MKNHKMLPFAAVVLMFGSVRAPAAEVRVIANSSVKADIVSAAELKRVFLELNNSLGDGTHVEPVLQKDGPVYEAFLQECLGETDDDLQNYYRALVFSGRGRCQRSLVRMRRS